MGDWNNISYYDFKALKALVTRLSMEITCLAGKDEFGITTLTPPVNAPVGNDPLVLINLSTGTIYYYDSDTSTWETAGGGSIVSDVVYGAGWNGDTTTAPSKNAVYDKVEAVIATIPTVSDAVYGAGWNGVITIAPSKNAVYDKIESLAGGTNFATTDLTLTGNRTHTGSNTRSLTIQNLTAFNVNTGSGNQGIALDNVGNGITLTSDATIYAFVDNGAGATGSFGATTGIASIAADAGTDDSGISLLPGISGIVLKDSQGIFIFDPNGNGLLPLLDDVGQPSEGLGDQILGINSTSGQIYRKVSVGSDTNFANTDLTFNAGDRSHDLNSSNLAFTGANVFTINSINNIEIKNNNGGGVTSEFNAGIGYSFINGTNGANSASVTADGTAGDISLYSSTSKYTITALPTYADDTAAGVGGLTAGRLYATATGQVMVKL